MPQLLGRTCLVCGGPAANRCSACAKAGIDLFFCSPEHQKLLWPTHKTFCGPGKANPWTWPPLTQEESERFLRNLQTPPGPVQHCEIPPMSMYVYIRDHLGLSVKEQKALIRTATKSHAPLPAEEQLATCIFRMAEEQWMLSYDPSRKVKSPELMSMIAFVSGFDLLFGPLPSFFTGFMHRLSVVAALAHPHTVTRGLDDEELYFGSLERLEAFISVAYDPEQPHAAQDLRYRFELVFNKSSPFHQPFPGVDVFFCSSEHQKLLWPLHRFFCGPGKANPFKWPALLQDETQHALQNLHTPPGSHAKGWMAKASTIAELLRDEAGIPSIQHISQIAAATEPVAHPGRQTEIVAINVRIAEYRLVRSNTCDIDLSTLPSLVSPLVYLTQLADIFGTFDLTAPWLPTFLHRLTAVAILHHKSSADINPDSELATDLTEARWALKEWVKDKVRPTHPSDAQRFMQMFSTLEINEAIAYANAERFARAADV
ncbi:hypothetical protein RTBOTA2_002862 [Rhodotorula toruloides]|nr:hypothetical protein RTBOTA2_002862 [Rhodotorula toruloides]